MSKSPLATQTYPAYSGNYTVGRSGKKIEAVTIHHMAGKLTAQQCGAIFQTVGRCGSSHYGIGYNGEIACYVEEENTAWTNSNWDSNCKSVTIETSNDENGGNWHVSDVTLNSLIKLVADIGKRNNQNFVSIPFLTFVKYVIYKANLKGIEVILTEESYTSGTSFLDNELPIKENYNSFYFRPCL